MAMAWELTGNSGTNAASDFLGTTDGKPLSVQPGAGNVGIGTTTPQGKLEVNGNWDEQHGVGALTLAGDKPTIRFSGGAIAGNQQWILHEGSDGPGDLQFYNGGATGAFSQPVLSLTPDGHAVVNGNWDEQHGVGALTLAGDKPTIRFSGGAIAGNQQWILHEGSDGPGDLEFYNGGATGAFSQPVLSLTPDGNIVVTGDIRLVNADCAEDFVVASAEPVEPGTVMVLGDEDTLQPSEHGYDKRVVGVISGAGNYKPGIVLDRQSRQQKRSPVALLGKVFCKVDAQYTSIEVGDLLTTSDTAGHAMKATDPVLAFGSVIGKALRPLREGQGLIPILVALQ